MTVPERNIDPVHRRDRRAWYECRYSCFQRSVRRKTGRKTTVYKNGATQDDEINAISGATVTTNAMTNGVNAGLCAFRVMEGGDQ